MEGGTAIEVDHFVYLESYIDQERDRWEEVRTRIANGALAFRNLEKIWKAKLLSIRTKFKIFNSDIMFIIMYACEG